jgi:hypothetical protein
VENDIAIINTIIKEQKINVNKLINSNNVLMFACYYNHNFKIIQYLIEKLHIDFLQTIAHKYDAFYYACHNKNLEITKYFIEQIISVYKIKSCNFNSQNKYLFDSNYIIFTETNAQINKNQQIIKNMLNIL